MTLRKPIKMSDDTWRYDHLDVVLRQSHDGDTPAVVLNDEGDPDAFNDPSISLKGMLEEARVYVGRARPPAGAVSA